jgi:hypothetical protein
MASRLADAELTTQSTIVHTAPNRQLKKTVCINLDPARKLLQGKITGRPFVIVSDAGSSNKRERSGAGGETRFVRYVSLRLSGCKSVDRRIPAHAPAAFASAPAAR